MGFWDRDVNNSFDRMFDLNRDGKLNPVEQGMQFEFLDRLTNDSSGNDSDYDDDDYDDDDYDSDGYDDDDYDSDFDGFGGDDFQYGNDFIESLIEDLEI